MCTLDCFIYFVYTELFLILCVHLIVSYTMHIFSVCPVHCTVGTPDCFRYYVYTVFSSVCLVGTLDRFLCYVYTGLFPILGIKCILVCFLYYVYTAFSSVCLVGKLACFLNYVTLYFFLSVL